MFEDVEQKTDLVITRESSDRSLAYVIWSRNLIGQVPVEEAWALLRDRYPTQSKFSLLQAYEELLARSKNERRGSDVAGWTPTAFLGTVKCILDAVGGRLNPEVRDLLAIASDELHPLSESDGGRLELIRGRVGARGGDASAASKRMARVASDAVRDLHDRTAGDKPFGSQKTGASEWRRLVEASGGAVKPYAVDAKVSSGQLVEHAKFGVGVVMGTEPGRCTILFETGTRKLIAG